jgi:signal transduction histidine kinase
MVSLLIGLRLARDLLPVTASDAVELLDRSIADAQTAIHELRELAYGVYPSVLMAKGLLAAVESLAARCAVPTTVAGECPMRLPAEVESNAYFVIAEALTNAVKHARAAHIRVSIAAADDCLRIEVADDGIGGASEDAAGSGLTGLMDRVAAFEGVLVIDSPPGRGTSVRAEIPVPR